jgi:leucyl aminopeptidase
LLDLRLASNPGSTAQLAVPVPARADEEAGDCVEATSYDPVALIPEDHRYDAAAFLADVSHTGAPGTVHVLPRPGQRPSRFIFFGVGTGDEYGWRTGGAAVARNASKQASVAVVLPADASPYAVRGFAEGSALAAYRYRLGADNPDKAPKLRRVRIVTNDADTGPFEEALATARAVVSATTFARDLTNAPSAQKTPAWFARQVDKAAARGDARLTVSVREPRTLAAEGFNGILAVGRGSAHPPRLVELSWRPRRARRHVVLVGKGITFDTGGICIKPREAMKLMRKDMGGAAAVVAATVAAAELNLPVRITALAPLAENMVGADSYRPGDVVRHYGGITSEITNTDAEGRLVLADALAYAVRRLRPDVIVDLATLTGAQSVALGKRTAALFSPNDDLAEALADAAALAGEKVWRMPLGEDYVEALNSDVADLVNSTDVGAGSMLAALFLREFTGAARDRWAHLDMSAPAWADSADGELVKGATGWGVRTLLRWLEAEARAG